ncbi:MAG: hypothetical protein CMD18_04900 [Flavobacteriales bacterium]|nr:hypothetical protein [Flavobacteriales bacterium]|tara:strand:- start:685 stop:3084 length:2400 start_codon:yes stop_codon:yes gene_type:complete
MRYFIALAIQLLAIISFSQSGIVSGEIIDESTRKAVPFCNIVLFNSNDSIVLGTIGSENGKFKIERIKQGDYYLSVQSLTHEIYKTEIFSISQKSFSKEFKTIALRVAAIQTDEITISVERAAVTIEPAKKTFDVKATGADAGGTAVDVLNNLPSVDVDDGGNVSLRGNGNIRLLIDGKPAGFTKGDITAVINQLPANAIETIEIITVPSAKYDPEGVGGIINIKLKREKKPGYRGGINISYSSLDKVNARIFLSANKKKWSINSSYNYTDGTYWSKRVNEGVFLESDSLSAFDNFGKNIKRTANQNGNISVEYKAKKNTLITLEGNLRAANTNEADSLEFYWNYSDLYKKSNTRNVDFNGFRLSSNGQFSIAHKTNRGSGIKLLSRINGVSNPKQSYFTEPYLLQKENKNFEAQSFVNQVDIEFPLLDAKDDTLNNRFLNIETGLKSAQRKFAEKYYLSQFNPSSVVYENQQEFSNELNYSEDIFAAYGLVKMGNKKRNISTGIRAEYSDISSSTLTRDYNKTLINLFPSASFVSNLSESATLIFNYSKRIKRPRGGQLNPIPTYSDPFTLRVGNADLIPEKSHMSEISYLRIKNKMVFNSTLFHQFRNDRLGRLSYTDSNAVSTILWINFNYHQTLGLELFTNYKFNNNIKINCSGTFYNTWVDGENFREGYTAVYFGFDLKTNLQLKLRKGTNLTVTSDYNSKRLAVVGVVIPRYGTDFSLKQKVANNKGILSLRLTDVFFTRRFGIDVDTDGWFREVRYRYESRLLWFGFNYSFGKSNSEKKNKFKRISPNDRSF